MKNKRKMRLLAALLAVMFRMAAFSLTVFASGGPEYEEALPEEQAEETTGGYELQPLTLEGNTSLVDDTQGETSGDKQFIIIATKNGNYFYIIIDRTEDGENMVYSLSQVDEADLLDLMDEEVKPQEPITMPEPEPTSESELGLEPKKSGADGILVVIFIFVLGGGGAFYYFRVMKPKQSVKGNSNLDDFDFEDDEDEEVEFENKQEDTEQRQK